MAQTSVSIDDNLLKKAQLLIPNISGVFQSAIKRQLNIKEIEVRDNCDFCGKEEIKASKDTNYIGLTWLCPDEKWICGSCLLSKMKNLTIVS